jgi:hypothetical protein
MRRSTASLRGTRPSLVACYVLCAVMVVMLLQMFPFENIAAEYRAAILTELSLPDQQHFHTSLPESDTDSLVRGPYKDLLPQNLREHKGPFCVQAFQDKKTWWQLDTLKGEYYNPSVHRYDPGPCDCDKLCSDSGSFDSHRCVGGNSFCCNASRAGRVLLSAGERCTAERYCCAVGLACVDATGHYSMTTGTCGRPSFCPSGCSFFNEECCHDARCDTGRGEVESGNGNCVAVPQWG